MEERRKYKRVSGRLRVVYKMDQEPVESSAYSVDISAGGFCLCLHRRVKKDTLLELLVYLPDNEKPFKCMGRVSWQDNDGTKDADGRMLYNTGLCFENLELKNRLRLIYYVHGKSKKINGHDRKDLS